MKRGTVALSVVVVTAALIGCIPEKRVVWSPDARSAAVVGADGLYLCDEHGELSGRLAECVRRVAWFPDSRRLVVVRADKAKSWDAVAQALDAEHVKRLEAFGDKLHAEVLAYQGDLDSFEPVSTEGLTGGEQGALFLYLRDRRSEGLPEKAGDKWDDLQDAEIDTWSLEVDEIRGGAIERASVVARSVATSVDGPREPRVSPDGKAVAYVGSMPGHSSLCRVFVVPADGSGPPRVVADYAGMFVDWSADGRYLAFAATSPPADPDSDDLRLGVVARRQVTDADGVLLETFPEREELAGIVFDQQTKVRCLEDGRVVFATFEVHLPATSRDMPERLGLFAVDPERRPTVTRLIPRQSEGDVSKGLLWFELSPDERHVCIPGGNGQVAVLTLATGEVWEVRREDEGDEIRMLPSWRTADELCFFVGPNPDDPQQRGQVVLCRLDWQTRTAQRKAISKDWPDAALPERPPKPQDIEQKEQDSGASAEE